MFFFAVSFIVVFACCFSGDFNNRCVCVMLWLYRIHFFVLYFCQFFSLLTWVNVFCCLYDTLPCRCRHIGAVEEELQLIMTTLETNVNTTSDQKCPLFLLKKSYNDVPMMGVKGAEND